MSGRKGATSHACTDESTWVPQEQASKTEAKKQAFGLFREASIIAKAGESVARWLNETRGSELCKAKSTESALRSLAHVSVIWTASSHGDADLGASEDAAPTNKKQNMRVRTV